MSRRAPRYDGFQPASEIASRIKKKNRQQDTKAELLLRKAVWQSGLRYRLHRDDLPGKPDLVFVRDRVAVFCDGDFWHGRNWANRRKKLKRGANPTYWIPKIEANIARDREQGDMLHRAGWSVVRIWESDIIRDPKSAADRVRSVVYRVRRRSSN